MSVDKPTKFVQANGLQIAYEEFGNPDDPLISLVSITSWFAGLLNSVSTWLPRAFGLSALIIAILV
jgi:hypothetical protein